MSIKLLLALLVSNSQKPSSKRSRHRIQACQTWKDCEPKSVLAAIIGDWEPLKSTLKQWRSLVVQWFLFLSIWDFGVCWRCQAESLGGSGCQLVCGAVPALLLCHSSPKDPNALVHSWILSRSKNVAFFSFLLISFLAVFLILPTRRPMSNNC